MPSNKSFSSSTSITNPICPSMVFLHDDEMPELNETITFRLLVLSPNTDVIVMEDTFVISIIDNEFGRYINESHTCIITC